MTEVQGRAVYFQRINHRGVAAATVEVLFMMHSLFTVAQWLSLYHLVSLSLFALILQSSTSPIFSMSLRIYVTTFTLSVPG